MPSDRGLLERLRKPDRRTTRSAHQSTERVADSVLAHLRRMLNTRHDDSPAVPEYGIPTFEAEYITQSDGMQRAIERSIREYEPRLEAVRVRYVPKDPDDPLKVRFEISARLMTKDEKVRVRFTSELDSSGEWKVRG
jgi:type VI secretion system protein